MIETQWGQVPNGNYMLGELVVTNDGVELEVTGLEPYRFEVAPQEDEDWGE